MSTIFIVIFFLKKLQLPNFGHELILIKEMAYHYDEGNLIPEGYDGITQIETDITLILQSS